MARKPLNARQLEVLRWIADGCSDGVWPDFTYKTTAVALRGRRLAKVTKRGGWRAEITDDGRHYLEHGAYPDQPAPVARPVKARPLPVRPSELPSEPNPTPKEEAKAADSPADGKPPIVVPLQLRNPHPAVAQLRDDKDRLGLTDGRRASSLSALVRRVGSRARHPLSCRSDIVVDAVAEGALSGSLFTVAGSG